MSRTKPAAFVALALAVILSLQTGLAAITQAATPLRYAGVNLAGADFGEGNLPGVYETDYIYPTTAEVDYFSSKGMNIIRLPFRWERLQRSLNGSFDATEQSRMDAIVNYATGKGITVLLDPHNYARYNGQVIGAGVPNSAFADFWSKLATHYKGNSRVIFGLMNEPNTLPTEQWRDGAQAAINAIRATGATQLILVPGNAWTGAWSWSQTWYGSSNASVMASITDPGNNFAYDVHQYLDSDSSGTNAACVSSTIGVERVSPFTNWLKQNGKRAFLGEFGGGANATCNAAINGLLSYLESNSDVWLGWSWWAAGPWWPVDYFLSIEPNNGDAPQMAILSQHLPPGGTTPTTQPTNTTRPTTQPTSNPTTQPTSTPGACAVTYTPNQWNTGFTAEVKLTNNGASTSNWTLTWSFAGNQQITSAWNATVTQSGSQVTVKPSASWNTTIPTGGSVGFGFQATYSGTNATPTNFALNGVACNGGPQPTTQPTVAPTNTTRPTNTTQPTVGPTNTTRPTNTTQPTVAPTNTTRPTNTTQPTVAPTNTTRPTNTTQPTTQPTSTPGACAVTYTPNQWNTGFTAEVKLTNNGASTSNWTLTWSFAGNQQITSAWNATVTQSGSQVTVKPSADWNATLPSGGSASFGFQASYSGTNATPTNFALNGVACNGGPQPTTTVQPTVAPTNQPTTGPTSQPTVAPTTGPTTQPTVAPTAIPGTHVDNPFFGAQGYINPDYAARVQAAATTTGGTLGARMAKVAQYSTAVWMDRTAAIAGSATARSLEGHLDAALAQQQASGQQVVITVVIYNLPNRDCSALSSNGELLIAQNGLARYQSEYIDPIAALFSKPKYSTLRIATIIEPDSLPNLLTNLSFAKCAEANSTGAYVKGVQYALNKLHAIPNVYTYIDIAHAGWLGWSSNFGPMVNLLKTTVGGTTAGLSSVDGFISNTANTSPVQEPFMTATQQVGGQPVRSAKFFDWNDYIDEASFDTGMYNALVAAGFPSNIGMLIDTSRNGWGGTARPTAASTSTDLNTFVNASKIDRRIHKGNWCNPDGAGIGARPQANPLPHFDAYVWIKPPGESDGSSAFIPNDEGKGFDRMCDPTYTGNSLNGNNLTGALPNAPLSGQWFQAQFEQLVQNAFPAFTP